MRAGGMEGRSWALQRHEMTNTRAVRDPYRVGAGKDRAPLDGSCGGEELSERGGAEAAEGSEGQGKNNRRSEKGGQENGWLRVRLEAENERERCRRMGGKWGEGGGWRVTNTHTHKHTNAD